MMQNIVQHLSGALRISAPLVLLGLFLVGSCKTSDLPVAYGGGTTMDARLALFPDSTADGDYYPAQGYIARAQDFVAGDAMTLLKLTKSEIAWLFGRPSFIRSEKPAQVWQYQTESCVVDFYFYDDGQAASKVAHFDIRPRPQTVPDFKLARFLGGLNLDKPSREGCLRATLRESVAFNGSKSL